MKKLNVKNKLNFRSLALAGIFMLAVVAVSCNKEDDTMPEQDALDGMQDIPSTLKAASGNADFFGAGDFDLKQGGKMPTFATLMKALEKTNLTSTVARNRLTVFAPSDEAFENLFATMDDVDGIEDIPAETLTSILLYHAVGEVVFSNQLPEGFVPTLNEAAVEVNPGEVMVNDASVIRADLKALNGVIHVIDKVLLPPTENLVELALGYDPEFSVLVQAVVAAGLAETLAGEGPFTVFAPTNDAFVDLLGKLNVSDLDELVDAIGLDGLQNVLLYHVVAGRVYSSDLPAGPLTVTAVSEDAFDIDASTLKITDFNGDEANLVPSLLNIQATNGVIHVIDAVILPEL